jgi:replicative DNA helicase
MNSETVLLGCLLNYPDLLERISIKEQDFIQRRHQLMFAEIEKSFGAGRPIDPIILMTRLQSTGSLEDCGGMVYINEVAQAGCSPRNAHVYADTVREESAKRQIAKILADACDGLAGRPASEVVDEVIGRLETCKNPSEAAQFVDAYAASVAHIATMERRADRLERYTSTGLQDLDNRLCGGFADGDMVIVAGRPSMGKTAFSLNLARATAETSPVLFVSMEMSTEQLWDRCVSAVGSVPIQWIRNPDRDNDSWNRYTAAMERMEKSKLFISDKGGQSLAQIRASAKRIKRQHDGIGMVIVDYLSLMTGGDAQNRTAEIGSYSRGLKALAKDLGCPVVVLSQLNRNLEARTNRRPQMSDLRDSGEVEQDADTILFLYRDEVYDQNSPDKGIAEIIIAKQRQGETGKAYLAFNGQFTRFDNLQRPYVERTKAVRKSPDYSGFE